MTSSLDESSKVAQSSIVFAGGPVTIVVSGATVSAPTSRVVLTGGCSTFRARSIARMRNVCVPGVRSLYSIGESHCSNGCESSWHWNWKTCSLAVKLMTASNTPSIGTTVAFVIVVTGGVVSRTIVQCHSAGEASASSPMSTARTRRTCGPSARPEKTPLLGQSVNATAPSSAHSNVACGSSLSKTKVAIDWPDSGSTSELGSDGPKMISVSGATLSTTVHSQVVT